MSQFKNYLTQHPRESFELSIKALELLIGMDSDKEKIVEYKKQLKFVKAELKEYNDCIEEDNRKYREEQRLWKERNANRQTN